MNQDQKLTKELHQKMEEELQKAIMDGFMSFFDKPRSRATRCMAIKMLLQMLGPDRSRVMIWYDKPTDLICFMGVKKKNIVKMSFKNVEKGDILTIDPKRYETKTPLKKAKIKKDKSK